MNKIYKVIWSKTRNCYVAVAEFVKHNGKGGSVLNRSHIAETLKKLQHAATFCDDVQLAAPFTCRHIAAALATVAICAAPAGALANSGGHWDGDDYIGDPTDYEVVIDSDVHGDVYGRYESGTRATGASVTVTSGTLTGFVYGGKSEYANAENNTVTMSGGKAHAAFGGRATASDVTGNKVEMSDGELVRLSDKSDPDFAVSGCLYGGYSDSGAVTDNSVDYSGGTVKRYLIGGYSKNGAAGKEGAGNRVVISGGVAESLAAGGYSARGDVEGNSLTISGGILHSVVYGARSDFANATGNAVNMSGGTAWSIVYGGHSANGNATGNEVTVSDGTIAGMIRGGYSERGMTTGNTVTIKGGTVGGSVYAGRSSEGKVEGNTLNLYGGTVQDAASAGYSGISGTVVGNTLTMSGGKAYAALGGWATDSDVTGNKVKMSGGELARLNDKSNPNFAVSGCLYGGYSDSGAVTDNSVDYSGGTVNGYLIGGYSKNGAVGKEGAGNHVVIRGGIAKTVAAGGHSVKADVEGNSLTISEGIVRSVVYGARSDFANATGNAVNISGGTAGAIVYGGHSANGNATGNEVTVSAGTIARMIRGGYSERGMATGNTVTIKDGTVGGSVYAGRSSEGKVEGNTLNLYGGTVQDAVSAGYSGISGTVVGNTLTMTGGKAMAAFGGRATASDVTGNKVEMSGGELLQLADSSDPDYGISGNLYGGYTDAGNVQKNVVEVSGGKVEIGLYGGYTKSGMAIGNTATVTGGDFFVDSVYGGYSDSLAEKNAVTLGGGTYDTGVNIVGGGSNKEANDNAVNLTGTTTGLDGAKLYGWKELNDGQTVTGSGNELHVGGTKTYDKNGNATITKGSWQGMDASGTHTNSVDTVANFDSIALHNVVWGDVPALSAKNMENIGGLDVTGLEFLTHPDNSTVHEHAPSDSMVLVHSDGKALTGLNISYMDEGTVKTEALTNEGINFRSTAHHSEKGGVTVDGKEVKRIYLADNNHSVDFLYHVDGDKITLGDVEFVKNGTARTLDGRFDVTDADIDADSFKMTGAGLENAVAGEAMTVLDAEDAIKAKGATATLKAFTGEGVSGGVKKYDVAFTDEVTTNLILSGIHTDTLFQNEEKTKLTYKVGEKNVSNAKFAGELAWQDGATHYTNKDYNFNTDAKTNLSGLSFGKATADPIGQSMTLIRGKAAGTVENAPASFGVSLSKANTTLDATAAGTAAIVNGDVTYSVTGVTLDKVTVNQITTGTDSVPDGWSIATGLSIDTENMTLPSGSANKEHAILTIYNGSFAGATVTGQYAYASHSPFTLGNDGVTVAGEKDGGLKLSDDNKSVVYHVVQDHVKDVTLGAINFEKYANLLTVGAEYEFKQVNTVNAQNFAMNYTAPQNVAAHDSMTLLQANSTLQANTLLANMAADVKTKTQAYNFVPADGVHVAAKITGSLGTTAGGDGFTFTVNSNQADKLTFGSVDWKDSGALLTRPANITFAGAAVDTSKIHFKNVHGLDANKQMTLVSDFGNKAGKISGSKYYIGTTLEGEGSATLNGNDLMFTTKTGTKALHAQEQTHNTVMGQTAGISLLFSGAEQISQTLNSLSLMDGLGGTTGTGTAGTGGNTGSNKTGRNSSGQQESNAETNCIIAAGVSGGHESVETGSHVTSNSWNGVLGIGGKRATKKGTLQYLAFAEHGRANFTLHSDAGRGDGTSKYVGGGLIAKWQNRNNLYTEASIRAGRMHDTASDLLYNEATGQSYGYDVHANYIGGHVGLGKVFYYDNGRSLDVYARYFHMKRDGVSFDAGGHFDLDSVTSSVLRVGARYGATSKKWNWYGGLAYEYEFDGKSTGRADGAEIRAASIEGSSVRGEIGLRMEATRTNPWKADINLSGFAGKRRGISGNVAVAYTF